MRSLPALPSSAPPKSPVPRLSPEAKLVLRGRYLAKNEHGTVTETVPEMFWRIATDIAQAEQLYAGSTRLPHGARQFYESMARLEFLPNSPTLMNAGRPLQQLAACFVLPVEDSLSSILEAVKQQALIHQSGGGTGFSFSRLRPQDDLVSSTQGIASGPVSFMRIFNMATDVIKQGGTRRGANMGILRVDHPDIVEFIALKQDPSAMNNFNLSVGITSDFMRALARNRHYPLINPRTRKPAKRLPARMVFERLVHAAWATGEPGVIFLDHINAGNPTPRLGDIEATNPCITGETWVQTTDGPRQAQDLAGVQFIALLNGQPYTTGHEGFFSTGIKPIFEVRTVEGYTIRLTGNHEVLRIRTKTRYRSETEWTKTEDLQPNDLIVLNDHGQAPCWPGPHKHEEGYLLGLLLGDGVLKADKAVLSVWEKAGVGAVTVMQEGLRCAMSLRHRSDFAGWREVEGRQEHRLALASLRDLALGLGVTPGKKTITSQVESCSSEFYRGLLRGLFDTDGSVQGSLLKGVSVRLSQSDLAFLQAVQRMLLRLGIVSRIYENRRLAGHTILPDGNGGHRKYPTLSQHELAVSGDSLIRFHETIGFTDRLKERKLCTFLSLYKRRLNSARFFARVKRIVPAGFKEVFDVSIPGAHAFDAAGFVVHNCGEQPLLAYESCTLGSINVSKFVRVGRPAPVIDYERLATAIGLAVRFLDNVIDRNHYPLKEIEIATLRTRKIGLGIMGFADLLIALNIPYDSETAIQQATSLMSFVRDQAHQASHRLGIQRGVFPAHRGSRLQSSHERRRNATVTTIAPTGTISLIAGCSAGIEPLYGVRVIRRAMDGLELTMVHPAFARMIRAHGLELDRILTELDGPSIQHVTRIPKDIRRLFVTAHDVVPRQHVRMQAAFQRSSDSGVSKTINLPSTATESDVADAFLLAYELKCKGLTVFRSGSREAQVLSCSPAQPC